MQKYQFINLFEFKISKFRLNKKGDFPKKLNLNAILAICKKKKMFQLKMKS